jgi:cytochrome c peroxidase
VKVFVENGCVSCHKGPRFTDDEFHWDGTQQVGEHVPPTDNGRIDDVAALLASPFTAGDAWSDAPETSRIPSLVGVSIPRSTFRTKSLRDLGTSAPYMHCGQFPTLEAVIDHYCGEGGASAEPPPPPGSTSGDTGGYGGSGPPPPPPQAPALDPPPMHFVSLTPAERTDLVAFLRTLDGEPLDPQLLKAEGP